MFYNQDFILGEVVGLATDFRSNLLQHATTSQLQCRTCTCVYMNCIILIHLAVHVHVHVCVSLWTDNTIQYSSSLHLLCRTYTKCTRTIIHVHDIIRKERKKERKQWQMKNESCLRWDSNPRHAVLQTDALPTKLPRQPSWQGPNQGLTKY